MCGRNKKRIFIKSTVSLFHLKFKINNSIHFISCDQLIVLFMFYFFVRVTIRFHILEMILRFLWILNKKENFVSNLTLPWASFPCASIINIHRIRFMFLWVVCMSFRIQIIKQYHTINLGCQATTVYVHTFMTVFVSAKHILRSESLLTIHFVHSSFRNVFEFFKNNNSKAQKKKIQ